jgi:hypothetical protein
MTEGIAVVTTSLFKQAKQSFGVGDYQHAVEMFEQGLLLRPDLYRVYRFNLASALANLKQTESRRSTPYLSATESEVRLKEATEEAELLLNQLFLVQEELERYFLLYQESQSKLSEVKKAEHEALAAAEAAKDRLAELTQMLEGERALKAQAEVERKREAKQRPKRRSR